MLVIAERSTIDQALLETNKEFDNNICYRDFSPANTKHTRWRVTLRTKDSRGKGSRLGFPKFVGLDKSPDYSKRRHLPYACWHVHGTFFDKLFAIDPDARIKSGSSLANPNRGDGGWITKGGGNWEDVNIGSTMVPYYFSEACECEKD